MQQQAEREWHIQRGDAQAATRARHDFARYLRGTSAGENERFDATIIFGELVANAVKSARNDVSVQVLTDGWLSLRVSDDGECFDRACLAAMPQYATSGRGLFIVDQLARQLHVDFRNERCEVTAELAIRP
jgi:anti-sigma regulatory factor (Ser/Thr protein kinase)